MDDVPVIVGVLEEEESVSIFAGSIEEHLAELYDAARLAMGEE